MATRHVSIAAVVLCALATGSAAQTLNIPKFFSMTRRHPAILPLDPNNPNFNHLVVGEITQMAHLNPKAEHMYDPAGGAHKLAQRLKEELDSGRMLPDRIAILLHGLGWDDANADEPANATMPSRFYCEAEAPAGDRIPGMLDGSFPVTTDNSRTNRSYRHPFLRNTQPDGPMRQWVEAFLDEYQHIQQYGNADWAPGALPDPARFYFDTEVWTAVSGHANPVWMLGQLAQRPEYWNRVLPGDPQGRTLAEAYDEARAAYSWPLDINDSVTGINPLLDRAAAHPRNRAVMIWFYEIIQRAEDAVMRNSCYEPIHARWPNAVVGNYGHSRMDGQIDSFGWFMDRDVNDQSDFPTRHAAQQFPRSFMEYNNLGAYLWHEPSGRWLSYPQWASGDVDQPFLWAINEYQWQGSAFEPGHRQQNLYLPGHPLETKQQTGLRMQRLAAESTINSGHGGNENRLVPWFEFAWTLTTQFDQPGGVYHWEDHFQLDDDFRLSLAMVRAKNMREACFWMNFDPFANNAEEAAQSKYAWEMTSAIMRQVYAARVSDYKDALGIFSPTEGADRDTSRLEFTLRSNGADRVVEIVAPTAGPGPAPMTQMLVYFDHLDAYANGTNKYDIVIDCDVSRADTLGMVMIWDPMPAPTGQKWVLVQPSAEEGVAYGFHAPQDANGRYQTRRVFRVAYTGNHPYFIDQDGVVALKLVHFCPPNPTANALLTSRYDLVQLIPSPQEMGGGLYLPPSEMPQSDVNLDGIVNEDDLTSYLTLWSRGEKAADMDMDDDVDETDLGKYLGHYINEN